MSIDYAKKERAFLSQLRSDSGHTLEEWLQLIDAERLSERNDIIDWLRQRGFTFSRASWLERIHHNGGQPIYADLIDPKAVPPLPRDAPPSVGNETNEAPARPIEQTSPPRLQDLDVQSAQRATRDVSAPTEPFTPSASQPVDDNPEAKLDTVLASAKGLRPLAQHVMREIQNAAPNAQVNSMSSALSFLIDGKAFAILTLAPKALKLGLVLPGELPAAPFEAPKFNPAPGLPTHGMTHMIDLNDVRQVETTVLGKIQQAAERV